MFILPRIIYSLFLGVCREWGLPVSLEREKENKTGRERQEREGGRKTKKKRLSQGYTVQYFWLHKSLS